MADEAELVEEIRQEVNELLDKKKEELTGEMPKRVKVLKKLYDAGCEASRDEWHDMAESVGYDLRGLGGFSSAQDNPYIVHVSKAGEDKKVILTDAGEEYLRKKGAI